MTTTLMIVHAWAQMRGITEDEAAEQIKELLIYGQKEDDLQEQAATKTCIDQF